MKIKTALILLICLNLILCASSQKKLEKSREKDPLYQYNMGLFFLNQGNTDEAIKHFNKALALKSDYDLALCMIGLAHSMNGKFNEAINYLKKALSISPGLTEAHNYLGVVYQELGLLDEAEKEFMIATLDKTYLSRDNPYYNLARIYFARDKLEEALNYVNKALEISRNFRMANNLKGMILEKQLKYKEAIESYKMALKNLETETALSRNVAMDYYVSINFSLAVAYFKNNELDKAKEIFINIYPGVTDPEMKLKIEQYLKAIK